MAERFSDPPKRQIIVGTTGRRSWTTFGRAAAVVLRQADNHKVRKLTLGFVFLQFLDDEISAELIRNRHVPADGFRRRERLDAFDRGSTSKDYILRFTFPGSIAG